jgi:predicted Zn-dependent protease
MVHELGHMAGLEHAADGSVMSSVVTPANSAVTFSSADLQTIFG